MKWEVYRHLGQPNYRAGEYTIEPRWVGGASIGFRGSKKIFQLYKDGLVVGRFRRLKDAKCNAAFNQLGIR